MLRTRLTDRLGIRHPILRAPMDKVAGAALAAAVSSAGGLGLIGGGYGDGRGLAACLMLGADGIMMGPRFWASAEAVGPDRAKARLVAASGDDTVRTKVFDLTRDLDWPWHFTGRVLHNDYSRCWHGDLDGLKEQIERERARYDEAAAEDYTTRVVIGGEVVDLIASVKPAADIIAETVGTALRLIRDAPTRYL